MRLLGASLPLLLDVKAIGCPGQNIGDVKDEIRVKFPEATNVNPIIYR
jgi:hypothetical protein